ncbi:MAG: peptide deformylase [Firmicutes bacterium]|nr:peptide deformylase [Bacillota bacterium]
MRSVPLKKITKEISTLVKNMLETMYEVDGIGLAANQVGLPLRLVVVDIGEGPIVLFNPCITEHDNEETVGREGCLSIPGLTGEVKRWEEIVVHGMAENGLGCERLEARGLLARVLQHEIDHLNGILFIDKAKDIRKEQVEAEV